MTKRSREPNGASTIYRGKDGFWHGRVTVGVRDDGRPDRRHVMRKVKADAIKAVRELERQRGAGSMRLAGRVWTVGEWLTYWLDTIAAPTVRENTLFCLRQSRNVAGATENRPYCGTISCTRTSCSGCG